MAGLCRLRRFERCAECCWTSPSLNMRGEADEGLDGSNDPCLALRRVGMEGCSGSPAFKKLHELEMARTGLGGIDRLRNHMHGIPVATKSLLLEFYERITGAGC
jgi:hypothetical protein